MKAFRLRKILIWGLGLLTVIGIGVGWFIYREVNQLKSQFVDALLHNQENTAVAAYSFDKNGELIEDGYSLFRNEDTHLVMASTMKIVVLAAYADAVMAGELDPLEQVPVSDWEAYYLPNTDGGAHIAGLQSLGLEADDFGFAQDRNATAPLQDLARIMIHNSGNAATDYLLDRLGEQRLAAVMSAISLQQHTPIWPNTGIVLAAYNYEGQLTQQDFESLFAALDQGDTHTFDELTGKYLNDPAWRAAQIEFLSAPVEDQSGEEDVLDTLAYQLAVSELFPRGTAREYAHLMAKIASGKLISPQVSALMQEILETNPAEDWLRLLFHKRFGAKPGLTMGVLTCATYAISKRGPLAGQSRAVVS